MNQVTDTKPETLSPRRPLRNDPANPLEQWLSGELFLCHPDGRLRRRETLKKLAWCVALLGCDRDTIAAALAERDQRENYQKFVKRPHAERIYRWMAHQAIRAHESWARRHTG